MRNEDQVVATIGVDGEVRFTVTVEPGREQRVQDKRFRIGRMEFKGTRAELAASLRRFADDLVAFGEVETEVSIVQPGPDGGS